MPTEYSLKEIRVMTDSQRMNLIWELTPQEWRTIGPLGFVMQGGVWNAYLKYLKITTDAKQVFEVEGPVIHDYPNLRNRSALVQVGDYQPGIPYPPDNDAAMILTFQEVNRDAEIPHNQRATYDN